MIACWSCARLNSTSCKVIDPGREMSFDVAKICDTMLGRCQSPFLRLARLHDRRKLSTAIHGRIFGKTPRSFNVCSRMRQVT